MIDFCKYFIIGTVGVLVFYLPLKVWADKEFSRRAEAGHRCTCRARPDDYCFECGH